MHIPVLLNEVIHHLNITRGDVIIDGTFGAGGYSRAILQANPEVQVIAIDRDEMVQPIAEKLAAEHKNFRFIHGDFAQLKHLLIGTAVNKFVFDFGVSSMQLDQAERGFSFLHSGPLDMRMSHTQNFSAHDIINSYSEKEIADILYKYGDERASFKIARAVCHERKEQPIATTVQLANIVRRVIGRFDGKIDPATRTFQALRIVVNEELQQLETALQDTAQLLPAGGRLVTVSFHSGEDQIIKSFFTRLCPKKVHHNKYKPQEKDQAQPFRHLHKGVIIPTDAEMRRNPRARSAKLRAIEKVI